MAFFEAVFPIIAPGKVFKPNWHYRAIARALRRVQRGDASWLAVAAPPRGGKSLMVSVAWAAFLLGHDPTLGIMCISHSRELAVKHSADFRRLLESHLFQRLFPNTRINPRKNTETEVTTTAGGFRLATSVEGTVTGRGAEYIIVDDPLQPDDAYSEARRTRVNDFITGSLSTRSNDKLAERVVFVMHRLHVDDPIGHLQAKMGDRLELVALPAIAPRDLDIPVGGGEVHHWREGALLHTGLWTHAVLDDQKVKMGPGRFAAMFLQAPVPPEGGIVKWEWFETYEAPPVRERQDLIILSFDTAMKSGELNDYSVGIAALLRGNQYFILDLIRGKWGFSELQRRTVAFAQKWQPDLFFVEDTMSGTSLIDQLVAARIPGFRNPIPVRPVHDKIMRMQTASAVIASGQVFLPAKAFWKDDFQPEMLSFPNGLHDDQVDAFSQLINEAEEHRKRRKRVSIPHGAIVIG